MSLEEKKILSEGHARCFLKRIFAIYAEHRPTVPIDEVVETVEQAGDELEAFYMALCTVHGLRAGLPTWEPPDDRPDWMPEFLMRDGTGRVPDLVAPEPAVVAGEGPMDARPKPVPKPKVVIRPARVPYTPAAKAAVPEPNAPVLAPPPPPPPAPPRLVPLPPPRPVHTPVAWWPAPPPPPAAKGKCLGCDAENWLEYDARWFFSLMTRRLSFDANRRNVLRKFRWRNFRYIRMTSHDLVKFNCHFPCQAQYFVKFKCHFLWLGPYMVTF